MAKREIFSVKALREKNYHTFLFSPEFAHLMGDPEKKFTSIHYGESGSGKSVFTLRFADYFAQKFGKVLYNSHEEAVNKTIQNRIVNFEIESPKLYVANAIPFGRMMDAIERNYYRLVIIDSVKYMGFTIDNLKELREHFAKRQLSIVMIDFGQSKGKPDSGKDLIHASDVKIYFKDGRAYSISRYLDKPAEKQLFIPQQAKQQLTLFG